MAKEKAIRVRLLAYDHKILDLCVEKILNVPAYNRYAPYLMTSVDTDSALAAREREALWPMLGPGVWTVFGGHGLGKVVDLKG